MPIKATLSPGKMLRVVTLPVNVFAAILKEYLIISFDFRFLKPAVPQILARRAGIFGDMDCQDVGAAIKGGVDLIGTAAFAAGPDLLITGFKDCVGIIIDIVPAFEEIAFFMNLILDGFPLPPGAQDGLADLFNRIGDRGCLANFIRVIRLPSCALNLPFCRSPRSHRRHRAFQTASG